MEIVCQKNSVNSSSSNYWNIEKHINPRLAAGHKGLYKTNFIKNFIDLNFAMWRTNNALTLNPYKKPEQNQSKVYHWPFLLRGFRMVAWKENAIKFYLIGNPIIWWITSVSLLIYFVLWVTYIIRGRRGKNDFQNTGIIFYTRKMGRICIWWVCWNGRLDVALFSVFYNGESSLVILVDFSLHHYFPALYFAMLLTSFLADHILKRFIKNKVIVHDLAIFFLSFVIFAVYLYFQDLALGFTGPASVYSGRKWLASWNIYDWI